jgi:hypothetical protein
VPKGSVVGFKESEPSIDAFGKRIGQSFYYRKVSAPKNIVRVSYYLFLIPFVQSLIYPQVHPALRPESLYPLSSQSISRKRAMMQEAIISHGKVKMEYLAFVI